MTTPLLDRLFAAAYDPVLRGAERAGLARRRAELLGDLAGHVVDVGAGTGANLAHLGAEVTGVTAVEPSAPMADRLRRRVAAGATSVPVEVLEAPAEALPLATASADTVVTTLVLCSVGDPAQALREIRRVLRPGGALVLLEHVGGTGTTRTLQRTLEPVWKAVAGNCHLTRDTAATVAAAGFDTSLLASVHLPLPAPTRPGLVGVARRSA